MMHSASGFVFFALVAIPVVNVISLPIAVAYYSRLFSLRLKTEVKA